MVVISAVKIALRLSNFCSLLDVMALMTTHRIKDIIN